MYDDIVAKLSKLAEGNETYAEFNKRIVNTEMPVIGVRVPDLRRLARELVPDMSAADISELLTVQDESFDYVLLCGLLITHARFDDHTAIDLTKQYLPRVDSWAHIDVFVEKKRRFAGEVWWDFALACLQGEAELTVRYGVVSLMTNFLDEAHIDQVFAALRDIKHDGYYVKMALAWLLKDPRITSVLVGASRAEQLLTNIRAINSAAFSEEELKEIDKITTENW